MRLRRTAVTLFACAIVVAMAFVGFHYWRQRRLIQDVNEATDDIADVISKLNADRTIFDRADEKADESTSRLLRDAFTPEMQRGAAYLRADLSVLRSCKDAEDRQEFDVVDQCLKDSGDLEHRAFSLLPEH